jgi:uncharacterized membrane protein YbjE (DUF340 family)
VNLIILLCLLLGIGLGVLLRERRALIKWSGRATTWSVYLLVFCLGGAVGANRTILDNLGRMGWQAVLICIGGILGSVCLVRLVSPYLLPSVTHEE